jgi:hypothetical protein
MCMWTVYTEAGCSRLNEDLILNESTLCGWISYDRVLHSFQGWYVNYHYSHIVYLVHRKLGAPCEKTSGRNHCVVGKNESGRRWGGQQWRLIVCLTVKCISQSSTPPITE